MGMAGTTSSSSSSSGRCSAGFYSTSRSSSVEQAPKLRGGSPGCVAMWVVNAVASAFFASMERCSCIRIATAEDEVDHENDIPLIHNDGNNVVVGPRDITTASGSKRRRTPKGKNKGTIKGP